MAFLHLEHDNVFLLRWREVTLDDLDRILEELQAMRARLGRDLVYIALIGSEVEPPSQEARKKMSATLDEVCRVCTSVHTVMEGSGLKYSAVRSAAAAVFLVSGNRKMHMNESFETAAIKAKLPPAVVDAVTKAGKTKGILR